MTTLGLIIWGLIPTFVEVAVEKLVEEAFLPNPTSPSPNPE